MDNTFNLEKTSVSYLGEKKKKKESGKKTSKKRNAYRTPYFSAFILLSCALVSFQIKRQVITHISHGSLFTSLTDLRKSKQQPLREGEGSQGREVLFLDFLAALTKHCNSFRTGVNHCAVLLSCFITED